jgi:hypothetical protein
MSEQYQLLLAKIDRFIRRYYMNRLVKGSLLFGAGFLILFLSFVLLESVGYFSSGVRAVLLGIFLVFNVFVLGRYVLIPFLGMLRIGRRVGPREAARILGQHFRKELGDRIINTLELKSYLDNNPANAALILAGIDQKASQASVVPFNQAVNMRGNLRFLPYLIVPLLFTLGFLLLQPALLMEPAQRIIRYETHFERPAPFAFEMESPGRGFRNEDLEVVLRARGSVLPAEAFILYNGGRFAMKTPGKGVFTHTLRNLQQTMQLQVEAGGFRFGPFLVEAIQKPAFSHFRVDVRYPAYTRIPAESYDNLGDFTVAEGSLVRWEFNTRGSGEVLFVDEGVEVPLEAVREGVFVKEVRATQSFHYKVYAWNQEAGRGDSLSYFVQVRKDQYPRIQAEAYQDSVLLAHLFHRGLVQDDYGFDRLEFRHRILDGREGGREDGRAFDTMPLEIDPHLNNQPFYHHFDLRSAGVGPGQTLEYFFEVHDNDRINGPKGARTQVYSFYVPSHEEILADSRARDERIREELGSGMGEVRQARDEIESLRRQMLESDRMTWEQQERIRDLLQKQQEAEEQLNRLSEQKKESEVRAEQFSETDERLREKQEELQRIFDEVLPEEMKELFDKIREELEMLDRNQMYDMLQRMEFEFRDLETRMDRALELFRQLEMERMLQQSMEQLDMLREDQEALSDESREEADSESLAGEQQELNERFEKLQDMLEQFREKNEELARPQPLEDTGEQEERIREMMEQALDQLEQGNPQQAQPRQKQAGQRMQELSEMLQGMQQGLFMEQMAEDSRTLREIMQNLLKSSFAQEELMLEVRTINVNDPRYVELVQQQRKIQEDLAMVEDSLIALSKRQAQIAAVVTREIGQIRMNMDQGLQHLAQRQRAQGVSRQQFVMTHINNLALLLNESLQEMMMQMAMASGMGEGMPQQGQESFEDLRQMQENLNQMLQDLQEGNMERPGGEGQPMSESEAMARMAAEQEAIRNRLKELAQEMLNQGLGDRDELMQLERDMERSELDMVRKQITRSTMLRQERILTRLLEHEKAEMEREMEERRVGNTANFYDISNPEGVFEYNRIRNRELEILRSLPAGLKPFYRTLVENYFLNVQDQ